MGDELIGQPAWVKAVAVVGLPAVILAVVLWFFFIKFERHVADTATLVQTIEEGADRSWAELAVMQRICLNTAHTDADRIACVAIAPGRVP